MHQTMHHLNDEHMRLYEWSGAGAGTTLAAATREKSKRTHAWHASYGVLALLTSLLALNGCDKTGPTQQAGEQVDQTLKQKPEEAAPPPMNEAAPAQGATPGQASDTPEQPGSAMQKQ
ncbi:MAG: hypothetical protein ACM3KD_02460 [Hyphomicrobiaceae bacterium]